MDSAYNTEKMSRGNEITRAVSKKKRNILLKKKLYEKGYRVLPVLLVFLLLIYIVLFSPIFAIEEIEIEGLDNLERRDMKEVLLPIKGENFFTTDLHKFREGVVKDFVFIKHVYTKKVFPNKVVVEITEREPFLIAKSDRNCYLIDVEGYVLLPDEWDCDSLKDVYEVNHIQGPDIDGITFEYGEKAELYNLDKIEDIVNVLSHYHYDIKEMELKEHVLRVYLSEDRKVVFVLLDDVDLLLKRFIIVHKQLNIEGIDFKNLDLRYERPAMVEK